MTFARVSSSDEADTELNSLSNLGVCSSAVNLPTHFQFPLLFVGSVAHLPYVKEAQLNSPVLAVQTPSSGPLPHIQNVTIAPQWSPDIRRTRVQYLHCVEDLEKRNFDG